MRGGANPFLRMDTSLGQKLTQTQTLVPQLRQGLRILAMNLPDLLIGLAFSKAKRTIVASKIEEVGRV